jgi:hypothetical protein
MILAAKGRPPLSDLRNWQETHMQIDFHHGVTYILARLAGFAHSDATTIAHAAQYVDDANNQGTIRFSDTSTYYHYASAWAISDVDEESQNTADYTVWVPFHFLPGNNGAVADGTTNVPLAQRLLCQPDCPLATRMWEECRKNASAPNALHRLGITCHVYEDTFSHQRFAGFRHDINDVASLSGIAPSTISLFDRLEDRFADILKLGHGGAGINPDLPYLSWHCQMKSGTAFDSVNPGVFLLACQRLFSQLTHYRGGDPNLELGASDQAQIVSLINSTQIKDGGQRHAVWLQAIGGGHFSFGAPTPEEMAELNYIAKGEGSWKYEALGTTSDQDSPLDRFVRPADFEQKDWYKFHEALKEHRSTVLDTLLPEFGLPGSVDAAKAAGLPL